ncbi:alpha/beta hydrolase [Bradyrhizobium sp. Ec3.3]|uniref:alpha/beta hydrolase n=1 Tax=Bradyrhizobium sp. Ec3.3 TaxID=189753 RepID=UPI000482FE40|nr:alpha/beta fold hydrolase [Bradyrhizobium sp. Ec3.3]
MHKTIIRTCDGIDLSATIVESKTEGRHWCVLAHGITADKEEEGAFERLAMDLSQSGVNSIRFDFRGHGQSSGSTEGMTIAGEMLDLEAVIRFVEAKKPAALLLVAASFGAVSASLLSAFLDRRVRAVVYWNPVLDLEWTFLKPTLPWGVKNFGADKVARVYSDGYFTIDGSFKAGHVFWAELRMQRPMDALLKSGFPLLIVHGDKDSYVPYEASKSAAELRPKTSLITIDNADHGFSLADDEERARVSTVDFLKRFID